MKSKRDLTRTGFTLDKVKEKRKQRIMRGAGISGNELDPVQKKGRYFNSQPKTINNKGVNHG